MLAIDFCNWRCWTTSLPKILRISVMSPRMHATLSALAQALSPIVSSGGG